MEGFGAKMTDSDRLYLLSLAIVVMLGLSLEKLVKTLSKRKSTRALLVDLLTESNKSNQSLVNLIVSRDFQTFAGLQSLSQASHPLSPVTIHSQSTTSEYIPRDDVTEANRMKAFGGQIGYGETIFEDDQNDEELKAAISDMVANGQVDFGEGVM